MNLLLMVNRNILLVPLPMCQVTTLARNTLVDLSKLDNFIDNVVCVWGLKSQNVHVLSY